MNLKFLIIFVVYYLAIMGFYAYGTSSLDGYSTNASFNTSGLSSSETDTVGLFSVGVSFARFFGFVLFGLFFPVSVPVWFSTLFVFWQTAVTITCIGWIFDSFWSG